LALGGIVESTDVAVPGEVRALFVDAAQAAPAPGSIASLIERRLDFESVPDLMPSGGVRLANGQLVVDTALWAAVAMARSDDGSSCTATLIGPRVLLTAAHCVDLGHAAAPGIDVSTHTRKGTVRFGGSPISLASCEMHPDYARRPWYGPQEPRSSDDVALCELSAPVTEVIKETLDVMQAPTLSESVLLTGYGCIGIKVVGGKFEYTLGDDKLRLGDAKVNAVGVGLQEDHGAYLRFSANGSEPVLCPGDSGGPAFRGASLARQDGPARRVVAVNSMVEAIKRPSGGHRYDSFVATLGTASFRAFQQRWSAQRPTERRICGIDIPAGTGNCRR
jgi:hypothetical protein